MFRLVLVEVPDTLGSGCLQLAQCPCWGQWDEPWLRGPFLLSSWVAPVLLALGMQLATVAPDRYGSII